MKILTWNINGLRATTFSGNFCDSNEIDDEPGKTSAPKGSTIKSLGTILNKLDADLICFQEVKTPRDQLEESLAIVPGFTSYFSFCRKKAAYSGVATYAKDFCSPFRVEEGLSGIFNGGSTSGEDLVGHYGDLSGFTKEELKELDSEGRSIITQHRLAEGASLTVINVYCPYGGEEGERIDFKMKFYKLLRIRASAILASGSSVVILGDINTSHHLIDHCEGDSRDPKEFYDNPGRTFLSHLLKLSSQSESQRERVKEGDPPLAAAHHYEISENDADESEKRLCSDPRCSDTLGDVDANDFNANLERHLFVDAFRIFHPKQKEAFTCWNTSIGARATNYGTRIDYIFPDVGLSNESLKNCEILPNIHGSDHCPVIAEFDVKMVAAKMIPPSATKFWPEYAGGKQRTIGAFFGKKSDSGGLAGNSGSEIIMKSESFEKRPMVSNDSSNAKRQKTKEQKPKPKTMLDFMMTKKVSDGQKTSSIIVLSNLSSYQSSTSSSSSSSSQSSISSSYSSQSTLSQKENDAIEGSLKNDKTQNDSVGAWKRLLKGPGLVPVCKGHGEPCVANKVKKTGPNMGKTFYACARPTGHASNKEARCNHFEWAKK